MEHRRLEDLIVNSDTTIEGAIEAINQGCSRGVFICDEDKELLGIVMDSDIRRAILGNFNLNASVVTIMNTTPFVINQDLSPEEKRRSFIKSDKILAPVVDRSRRVVDSVRLSDVMEQIYLAKAFEDHYKSPSQKILVIGGAGYIGSVLTDKLLRMGHQVRVVDLLLYGKKSIECFGKRRFDFVRGDCRDRNTIEAALDGMDSVVHLGEIVGDPACGVNETLTIGTNYSATQMIAEACVKRGIKRFVFASSCSVYGQNGDDVNEMSEPNPISLYARCKIESEKAVLSFDYNRFCPTVLRLATVHGISFRQRFDLVVNLLAIKALTERKIKIFGGAQWRPFISVKDVCRGIVAVLHSDTEDVRNKIFNLGDSSENHQLIQIGRMIKRLMPETKMEVLEDEVDRRSYRVKFDKIRGALGFYAEHRIADSLMEFVTAYKNQKLFHDYREPRYYNALTLNGKG
ncbi:MAG: NAD-dependent epimerase/dehydratase family protein [Deltaproteobacteria bacterium]|nr:NAD-dependent epimerase/dehydratase family protein [Deltaproteobacteria bacterium]